MKPSELHRFTPLRRGNGFKLEARRRGWSPLSLDRQVDKYRSSARRAAQDAYQDARRKVWQRDMHRCGVCGLRVAEDVWEFSHRLSRGSGKVIDCPCNGVVTHPTCHRTNPDSLENQRAKWVESGLVISRHERRAPTEIPVRHAVHGLVLLDCEGGYTQAGEAA